MTDYDRYVFGCMFRLIMQSLFFLIGFAMRIPVPDGYWESQYRELSDTYVDLNTRINTTWDVIK